MHNITIQNKRFPFCCPVLWVSLTSLATLVVSLLVLTPIYLLYFRNHISTEVTLWATLGVFVAAVFYDFLLLFLINKNNRNSSHQNGAPNGGNLTPNPF